MKGQLAERVPAAALTPNRPAPFTVAWRKRYGLPVVITEN
jgi:hypothetical protein